MATNKNAKAICDTCGFQYPLRVLKKNSYGMMVCPTDWEGQYDLKNHPQNKAPDVRDNPAIQNPRPDTGGRNLEWQQASFDWDDSTIRFWSNA